MIGKKILNYEIKKLLGEGGMGNVYLAEHAQLGRKVAIKSLHQQLVKNEGLSARFKKEASTMELLKHPKIVDLHDFVEEADGLFLVMEYVEGLPLDEYIRKKSGPIPYETVIPMMTQILDAFSYAHSKGIVHRDIKPSNILITNNGDVKILDFGIAKIMNEEASPLTKTGTQMGTVYYMSPEQVQVKEIDIRSDIYSLGVTLHQMLTGSRPYDGIQSEYEVYSKIINEPLPAASKLYHGVPDFLDKVIMKATHKNKADRYQSCEEFSKYLYERKTPDIENKTLDNAKFPKTISITYRLVYCLIFLSFASAGTYLFQILNNKEVAVATFGDTNPPPPEDVKGKGDERGKGGPVVVVFGDNQLLSCDDTLKDGSLMHKVGENQTYDGILNKHKEKYKEAYDFKEDFNENGSKVDRNKNIKAGQKIKWKKKKIVPKVVQAPSNTSAEDKAKKAADAKAKTEADAKAKTEADAKAKTEAKASKTKAKAKIKAEKDADYYNDYKTDEVESPKK